MISVPGPSNIYHKMKYNSAITRQNQLKFWNQKAEQGFSLQSKNLVIKLTFSVPYPLM